MSLPRVFFGYWKVSEVTGRPKYDVEDIIGEEFQLTSTGNVIWKTEKTRNNFPLTKCIIYVIHKTNCIPYRKLKFATSSGYVVDCEIESIKCSGVFVFNDGWYTYTCKKIRDPYGDYPVDIPFNFLPALENSYFSDLIIKASNQKEFQVQKCILKYAAPEIDWRVNPPPLSGYSEDVLRTILHFLYGGCLPRESNERTLNEVISVAKNLPGMENLVSLCTFQSENLTFKKKIIDLISDVGVCIAKMKDVIKKPDQNFRIFPYKYEEIYTSVKKSFQEGGVAVAKFLVICKTYVDAGDKLSQEDSLEILEHILSQIPIFNNHLQEYIQNLIGTIRKLHAFPDCWESFLSFLLPKVQGILDTISKLLLQIGDSLGAMASAFQDRFDDFYVAKHFESIQVTTDSDVNKCPLNTVLFFAKEFKGILFHFEKEKRRFNRIDLQSKVRLISVALDDFLAEIANFRSAFRDFKAFLEKQVVKGKIYFEMRVIALKINDVLTRILTRRTALTDLLLQFCDLIERDSFFECLISLGFLDAHEETIEDEEETIMFPLIESACKSPPIYLSHLSEVGRKLLASKYLNDMAFGVIPSKEPATVNLALDDSDSETSCLESESESDLEFEEKRAFVVAAHRAVVSARCEWFRIALLSGMKEDINRKIEIPTTPTLMSSLLEFIYSGRLSNSGTSFNHLLKLLILSDRYDFEHLREVCEFHLQNYVDENTISTLYNIADRYRANKLRFYCEDFITENPTIIQSFRFRRLPEHLIHEGLICSKGHSTKSSYLINLLCKDSFDTFEESLSKIKEYLNNYQKEPTTYEKTISALGPKLEKAMMRLREKIGSEVPRKVLMRTILDTDYDVERAAVLYILRKHI